MKIIYLTGLKTILTTVLVSLFLSGTVNAQLTFTSVTSPTTENLKKVHFIDGDRGFACGEKGAFLKTTDGGSTWASVSTGVTITIWDVKSVPGTNGQTLFAVGDQGLIMKSTDGGDTWTGTSSPVSQGYIFSLQCIDQNTFVACGSETSSLKAFVLVSTNGGSSWIKNNFATAPIMDKVFFIDASTGFAVGNNASFADGGIWKTTDGGSTWTNVHSAAKIYNSIWAVTASQLIAVGSDGQIATTTDGGNTWTDANSGTTKALYDVYFKNSKDGYACGGDGSSNVILETTDGGSTWSTVNYAGATARLNGMVHAGTNLIVVGNGGHIAKGAVGLDVNTISNISSKVTVSPNPARDEILLQTEATETQPIQFFMIGLNGKVVKQVVLTQGNVSIQIADVPSGIYTYMLSDSNKSSGKIVVE